MRAFLIVSFLLFCSFGCEKSVQTDAKSFELTMQKQLKMGSCGLYYLTVDSDGKVTTERHCTHYVECESYESKGVSTEKRRCPKHESEKIERQLNRIEITELISETEKTNFFSYKDDYRAESKNCSSYSTDAPNVNLKIKIDEREKEIKYDYGCFVKSWLSNENALQPLMNLENKVIQTSGIENWTKGQK